MSPLESIEFLKSHTHDERYNDCAATVVELVAEVERLETSADNMGDEIGELSRQLHTPSDDLDMQHLSDLIAEVRTNDALEYIHSKLYAIVTTPKSTKEMARIRSAV